MNRGRGSISRPRKDGPWYAWRYIAERRRWERRSTDSKVRRVAASVAARWLEEGERAAAGFAPETAPEQLGILPRIEQFIASKRNETKRVTAKHLRETKAMLLRVVEISGWTLLEDVTQDGLLEAVAALSRRRAEEERQKAKRRAERQAKRDGLDEAGVAAAGEAVMDPEVEFRGFSNATLNAYRAAWKALVRWGHQNGLTAKNPLARLDKWRTEGFETYRRRALTHKEFWTLFTKTKKSEPRDGLAGEDRAMLYMVAVSTGFRWSELASLTGRSFQLQGEHPSVALGASSSKNRKPVLQPLPDPVVPIIAPWAVSLSKDRRAWSLGESGAGAHLIRSDLEAAGLETTDEEGRVADFHCLRHTFGTWLAQADVSPQKARELMRHSDINLTLRLYTHLKHADLAPQLGNAFRGQRSTGATVDALTKHDETGPTLVDRASEGIAPASGDGDAQP